MSTAAASSSTRLRTTQQVSAKGHIGLVVLAPIAAGLALGLMLVLGLFAGGDEPRIIGSALVALGAGFALLAIASSVSGLALVASAVAVLCVASCALKAESYRAEPATAPAEPASRAERNDADGRRV